MSMHLHHPSLSLTGKKKGKKKFSSAEEKRRAEELEQSWNSLQKKWAPSVSVTKSNATYKGLSNPRILETKRFPSVDSGKGVASKAAEKVYTGDKVLGIAVMHKSCLQPVFDQQSAIDSAKMRR